MSDFICCRVSCVTICCMLIVNVTILAFTSGLVSMPTFLYLAEHKQLIDDWTTQPFIDLRVSESNSGCPADYEPIFSLMWNGTYEVCH